MSKISYKYMWYASALMTLCWFITTMYLPALPHLKQALSTTEFLIKTAVSIYFIFFCFGQFVFGPLSDHYKRLTLINLTLLLSSIGTLLCLLSTNIWVFMIGRSLQGLGMGAIPALTRSFINDVYHADKVLKLMIYLTSIIAVATSIAPLIGAYFLEFSGWRSIFIFQFIFSLTIFLIGIVFISSYYTSTTRSQNIFHNYYLTLKNKSVVFHMTVYSLIVGSLIAFYSESPYLLIVNMNLSSKHYGFILLSASFFYIIAVIIIRLLLNKIKPKRLLFIGILICLLGGSSFLIINLFTIQAIWTILFPLFIYLFGAAFIPPITNTEAMQALPPLSGTVSSLLGSTLAFSSGILSYVLVNIPITHLALFSTFFICIPGLMCLYYFCHFKNQ